MRVAHGILGTLSALLLTSVLASPLNEEQHSGLAARATGGGKYVGSACKTNAECYSQNCALTNGTKGARTCQRQPAGGPCSENANCESRTCDTASRKCQALPPTTKREPTAPCDADSQCLSKRCTDDHELKDQYGLTYDTQTGTGSKWCSYLANGQSGCTTYRDCSTGVCKNGTCQRGTDGDRCIADRMCADLCGLDGRCFTRTSRAPQGAGSQCLVGTDCISGRCYIDVEERFTRPAIDDPSQTVTVADGFCGLSDPGQRCAKKSDCRFDTCNSQGLCGGAPIGAKCTSSTQCLSQRCDFRTTSPTRGTCVLSSFDAFCTQDSQCFSGQCDNVDCYFYNCVNDGACRGVLSQGTCRFTADCFEGLSCVNRKCQ